MRQHIFKPGAEVGLDGTGCARFDGLAAGFHELRLTARRKSDDSELKGGPVSVRVVPGVTSSAEI
jgi:hypothetical protein